MRHRFRQHKFCKRIVVESSVSYYLYAVEVEFLQIRTPRKHTIGNHLEPFGEFQALNIHICKDILSVLYVRIQIDHCRIGTFEATIAITCYGRGRFNLLQALAPHKHKIGIFGDYCREAHLLQSGTSFKQVGGVNGSNALRENDLAELSAAQSVLFNSAQRFGKYHRVQRGAAPE